MASYRDAHIGSQAIHLAATTGNTYVIETLIDFYGSDPKAFTAQN